MRIRACARLPMCGVPRMHAVVWVRGHIRLRVSVPMCTEAPFCNLELSSETCASYARLHECTGMYAFICVRARARVHVHVCVCVRGFVGGCVRVCVRVCVCVREREREPMSTDGQYTQPPPKSSETVTSSARTDSACGSAPLDR